MPLDRSTPYRTSARQATACVGCGTTLDTGRLRCETCELVLHAELLTLLCPHCHQRLETGAPELGAPMTCSRCAGCFVDVEELQLLEANAQQLSPVGSTPSTSAAVAVAYAPCPKCGKRMNRVNYGPKSGLVVDVCKMHGTWFDRGELERGLAFVAAGGKRSWPNVPERPEPSSSVVEQVAKGLSTPVRTRTDAQSLLAELIQLVFGF